MSDVEMREERQDEDMRDAAREIARERRGNLTERMAQAREQRSEDRRSDDAGTEAAADRDPGTSLFTPDRGEELRTRWSDVQARFVDDPRDAVKAADALVEDVIRDLSKQFSEERSRLEGQWGRNDEVSTEDLRLALQRYRSFFERLLSV